MTSYGGSGRVRRQAVTGGAWRCIRPARALGWRPIEKIPGVYLRKTSDVPGVDLRGLPCRCPVR